MRRFVWRWAWGLALLAVGLAFVLRRWGGYWHITRWATPLPRPAETQEIPQAPPREEVPVVVGEVTDDTRKAIGKRLEEEKKAREKGR